MTVARKTSPMISQRTWGIETPASRRLASAFFAAYLRAFPAFCRGLLPEPGAAVDLDRFADEERARVAGEKATTRATSSGVPARPSGMPLAIVVNASGAVKRPWNAVSPIRPGATQLTRTPCGASSFGHGFGEAEYRGLRHRVGGRAGAAAVVRRQRRHVDDRAALLRDHAARGRLRDRRTWT